MASATMSDIENKTTLKNSETETECEVTVQMCEYVDSDTNIIDDDEKIRDNDIDTPEQEFSNNATDLGIPVQLQDDLFDKSNVIKAEKCVEEKSMPEKSEVQEEPKCDQVC